MAVTLTGGGGGLFNRVGAIGGGLLDLVAIQGGAATARTLSGAKWTTRANTLDGYYATSVAQQKVLDGLYNALAGWQSSQSGFVSQLKTIAANTVVEMVNADTPLASKTLASAMAELIRQMRATSDSVNASAPAVGSQTAVGSPVGDPAVVLSLKGPDGRTREYVFAETIKFQAATDQYSGGTLDRESYTVSSPAQVSDTFAHNYPGGSGTSKSLTAVDPTLNASTNLTTNGDFTDFTANVPDNWALLVGAAGTDVLAAGSSDAYGGTGNALQFAYNAAVPLSSVAQTFGSSSGTTATLKPNTVYLLNLFAKKTSGLTGNGTVEVSLVNSSNTILTDDAGNDCKFTFTAASLTTSYGKQSGAIVTPANLPTSGYKLRVRMSVAIADSSKSVYIDNVSMVAGTELYTGGPYAAVFPGSTPVVRGDAWTVAITNTEGVVQNLFQRLFDLRGMNLQLPSSGSPTVADSVVA